MKSHIVFVLLTRLRPCSGASASLIVTSPRTSYCDLAQTVRVFREPGARCQSYFDYTKNCQSVQGASLILTSPRISNYYYTKNCRVFRVPGATLILSAPRIVSVFRGAIQVANLILTTPRTVRVLRGASLILTTPRTSYSDYTKNSQSVHGARLLLTTPEIVRVFRLPCVHVQELSRVFREPGAKLSECSWCQPYFDFSKNFLFRLGTSVP
ncbi:hypothetical protein DPMN_166821, partial [Dreissena polymorpha]